VDAPVIPATIDPQMLVPPEKRDYRQLGIGGKPHDDKRTYQDLGIVAYANAPLNN
jgi:hypothetical protein